MSSNSDLVPTLAFAKNTSKAVLEQAAAFRTAGVPDVDRARELFSQLSLNTMVLVRLLLFD